LNETPIRSSTLFWPAQVGEDTRRSILVLIGADWGNPGGFVAFVRPLRSIVVRGLWIA
jgi:hypothetical protein